MYQDGPTQNNRSLAMWVTPFAKTVACLGVALIVGAARADTVTLRDGKTVADVTVTGVDATAVQCAKHAPIPRDTVQRIEREAFAVPAMAGSVTLRDGTRLCGRVRAFKSAKLTFRSVSAGQLVLPLAQLAAIRYLEDTASLALPDQPDAGAAATAMRTDGEHVNGQLMWADAASAGLLTGTGLVKIPAEELVGIVIAPAPKSAALTLRNGDRLGTVLAADGATVKVDLGGVAATLPFEAVHQWNLQPATKD